MLEVLNSNESYLDKELKVAISGFNKEEIDLENTINNQNQEEIEKVEKIWPNKVKFPYKWWGYECTLILERKGNRVFVKLEDGEVPKYGWKAMTEEYDDKAPNHQTQGHKEKANLLVNWANFEVTSSKDFLIKLGDILNIAISPKRVSAADKWEQAYDLLFPQK